MVLCTLGPTTSFDLLEDLKKKRRELCRLFNIGTLVRGPPSTALKILSRGVGDHLLTQHRRTVHRQFLCFLPTILARQGPLGNCILTSTYPETNSPTTYRQPARGLSSAEPLSRQCGRPTSSSSIPQRQQPRSRSRSVPPIPVPSPPPFRPPLATCWCRLSKQPAGAEGASCTRGTPARPAAATAASSRSEAAPPLSPKSLCGHPNVGKPKPPQRFE